jgi:amino acid transporter
MSRSAGRIGWFLAWAVVFCDIGTSVYYVPGILYGSTGDRAGFFVLATLVAFVLLAVKYVEVTRRFPSGGGVVSVADEALGPWWGAVGGQLIMVDYFLTVAISAVSGVYYVDSMWGLAGNVVPWTLGCLAVLCVLNIIGVKESATASLALAVVALAVDLAVIGTSLWQLPAETWSTLVAQAGSLRELTPWQALVGYSGAWLAFSGLESISQLSPAMRDLGPTPRKGMIAVVISVLLTAPALTFLSTLSLDAHVKAAESERFISELGAAWGGVGLKAAVVLSASTLLLFAANTAIIGNYHVMMALRRRQFLPDFLGALSHRFQTPHRAIVLCVAVPIGVIVFAGGNMTLLGELYAFGLLGAFILTSIGVDVLRWRDGERGGTFWLGIVTTLLVAAAFGVNLVAKPMATAFGSTLAGVGLVVGWATRTGRFDALVERIPRLSPPREVESAEVVFKTIEQARDLAEATTATAPNILVASRGATRKIFKEACERAKQRGLDHVFLIYVDEVPGLFYPELAAPTPEGLTVLEAGTAMIESLGMKSVPVWALGHSAAGLVVDAAEAVRADTVVIGATHRTFLWTALRGKFIADLVGQLPKTIRLVVIG